MGNLDRWAKLDEKIGGSFVVKTMQCERCMYRLKNPMICEKYPERKPNNVLRCEGGCPEFKEQVQI